VRPLGQQTILITGATDGLGRALATTLAHDGPELLLHERGGAMLEEIRTKTGNNRLRWLRADLASLDDVRALANQVVQTTDRLDALVNNAGIGTTLPGDGNRLDSGDGTSSASPSTTSRASC
jgi:NAD(P)-dependent dehydrogenase (short-subunit alcohol dehydrogenase family)